MSRTTSMGRPSSMGHGEVVGRHSVVMTDDVAARLVRHLLRGDGQEDLCLVR
jgi:hypothetical protein